MTAQPTVREVDIRGSAQLPVFDQGILPMCAAAITTLLHSHAQERLATGPVQFDVEWLYDMARAVTDRPSGSGTTVTACDEVARTRGLRTVAGEVVHPSVGLVRVDGGRTGPDLIDTLRSRLAQKWPVTIEIDLRDSVALSIASGYFFLPDPAEATHGRHQLLCLGFKDDLVLHHRDGARTTGALLVRNSWGRQWGMGGDGWLPYRFAELRDTIECWTVDHEVTDA